MGNAYQMSPDFSDNIFFFATRDEIDILNFKKLDKFFTKNKIDYAINFASFNDMEKAEENSGIAYETNCIGTRNLATICEKYGSSLIHVSSSHVFSGDKLESYTEEDLPEPVNEFGKTKLAGEQEIQKLCKKYVILRIGWLYSNFSKNFYTELLNLSQKTSEINVSAEEFGSPISSNELCRAIDAVIRKGITEQNSGVYHFSGKGITTMVDFAAEIFKQSSLPVDVVPVLFNDPKYLIPLNTHLSTEKFEKEFEYSPLHWKMALTEIISDKKIFPIKVGFRSIINEKEYVIASLDWSKEEVTLINTEDMKTRISLSFSDVIVQHR